jgi:6-pyruvoyltetrahydropterin/6-carboxytetrahydropterin synthase
VPYTIGKRFSFCASHALPGLPSGHKCARTHGHNYVVEVVLQADELEPPGFVTDFGDLAPLKTYLDNAFDHRHLNDVLEVPPTSEHLAAHIALRSRPGRRVSEPHTWADTPSGRP